MTQFSDDEVEIIKELICDWGSDCPSADYDKVRTQLRVRLPTEYPEYSPPKWLVQLTWPIEHAGKS